jgi:Fe-S cluster assembly ATP-binding protein
MLELKNVSVQVQSEGTPLDILRGLSLTFQPGCFYSVTGPNGGGKTTLAKVIAGIAPLASGSIVLDGEDLSTLSISERARKGIRYAFQHPPRFKGIDVTTFLRLAAGGELDAKTLRRTLRHVGLCPEEYLNRMVDTGLSGGEMKRLEVASAILGATKVVILDEPEAGVDLWGFEQLVQVVADSHREHPDRITIVISHSERFISQADELIVLADGQVQSQGKLSELRTSIMEELNCRWRNQCQVEEDEDAVECYR